MKKVLLLIIVLLIMSIIGYTCINKDTYAIDGSWYTKNGLAVNSPNLFINEENKSTLLKPIYWDENNELCYIDDISSKEYRLWYDYSKAQWANAQSEDGSYWVWIPKYAYRITEGYHQGGDDVQGKIDIIFLGEKDIVPDGYTLHSAFVVDNVELSGMWIAKFESSRKDATITEYGVADEFVSVPGKKSAAELSIGECYAFAKEYNEELNSHMVKNTEWGLVTYLSHSIYGVDGKKPASNNCEDMIAGAGNGMNNERYNITSEDDYKKYAYNTPSAIKTTTTGNIYGIYDMTGGVWEYIAGYANNITDEILKIYGGDLLSTDVNERKFKDIYNLKNDGIVLGDAVYETSTGEDGFNAWNGEEIKFIHEGKPFFLRGGFSNSGDNYYLFYYTRQPGDPFERDGFRMVLWGELE